MKNFIHGQHIESHQEGYVPWSILDVFFSYVFIFTLSIIFTGILLYTGADANMNFFVVALQLLVSMATLAIVYYIITKKYNVSFREALGLYTKNIPSSINIGIFVTLMIILTTSFISIIFSQFTGAEPRDPYMNMPQDRLKWITVLAVFIAPIVEEIFFRGFMQPAISKTTGPVFGILITALIFGASHTQYLDYGTAIVSVTAIGVILGVVKYKTGSVMPGIFAHFFNNLLAIVLIVT